MTYHYHACSEVPTLTTLIRKVLHCGQACLQWHLLDRIICSLLLLKLQTGCKLLSMYDSKQDLMESCSSGGKARTHIYDLVGSCSKYQVGLLFFSIFWGFFPLYNAIFAFPMERPMLNKERSSGMYHLSSYYVARMVGDLPMELVLPTIFATISY